MSVTIRATNDGDGNWGDASLLDVEAVATSVSGCFSAFADDEAVAIKLEPTGTEDDPPRTHLTINELGEFVVELNVRGRLWARLVYQFAHEFCHVVADSTTLPWPPDRFMWIEESICEAASLFALGRTAERWAVEPPYPHWRSYSADLASYEACHGARQVNCLPPGAEFEPWLSEHLPLLEEDSGRREDNTIIAKELIPIFERDPAAWRVARHLHTPHSATATYAEFFDGWAMACHAECRPAVESISNLLNAESTA